MSLLADEQDVVAVHLGRGQRLVLPVLLLTLISLIQCKNTSLATNFLDNIGVPYHALECEHGTHCVLAFFHNGMGSTSNGLCSNLM